MEKTQTNDFETDFSQISDEYVGDSLIINKKQDPCDEFKENLSMCMKNSDDNITACQSLKTIYEDCLREENKRMR